MPKSVCKNNNLIIYNILRRLGLQPNHSGIIFIMQAIQIVKNKGDIIIINDIYIELSKKYKTFSSEKIKKSIQYALKCRNGEKSKKNFKDIFGYEYDEYIFTNKAFIEEIVRIMQLNY